jgi:hypothetical protein
LLHCGLALFALATSAAALCADDQKAEDKLIRSLSGRVERQGSTLTLQTNQAPVVLTDVSCEPDPTPQECVSHELVAHDSAHRVYLVENTYYEGHDYTLVTEEAGLAVRIKGVPHYSPSGRRIVVVNADEAFSFNGIQLWRTLGGGLGLEWEYSPTEGKRCFQATFLSAVTAG